jgi:hypothetical protein
MSLFIEASDFGSSDLIPGAVYKAPTRSIGKGNEVLSQLLPGISNSGGFRPRAGDGDPQIVVLYSTGAEGEWPDSLDEVGKSFTYFGDNRKPGNEIHSTPRGGNRLLRKWFDALESGTRETVPLILGFRKALAAGGGDVEFIGVLVPGGQTQGLGEALVVERRHDPKGDFENYKAQFTVLDTGPVDGGFVRRAIEEREIDWGDPNLPGPLRTWREGRTSGFRDRPSDEVEVAVSETPGAENIRSSFFASLKRSARVPVEAFEPSEISAKPGLEVLRTYRSMVLTPWHALGEFVDNAVTSFWDQVVDHPDDSRFDHLTVDITWDSVSQILTISDNAAGIPFTQAGWGRALQAGVANPNPRALSVHGVGMKAAGLWWAPVIKVRSKFIDDNFEVSAKFDLDEMIESGVDKVPLVKKPVPDLSSHGTTITLEGLNPGRSYPQTTSVTKVRTFLASMYRSYLRGDEAFLHPRTGKKWLSITVAGKKLAYEEPDVLFKPYWPNDKGPGENTESIIWRKNFTMAIPTLRAAERGSNTVVVAGWMGILAKMEKGRSGLFLTFRGKGVSGVEQGTGSDGAAYRPFKIFGPPQGQRARRLIGEFEVSGFGKSLTTDAVNWSPEEEEAFIDALLAQIKDPEFPIYQMATNFRAQAREEMTKSEIDHINEVIEEAVADTQTVVKTAAYDIESLAEPQGQAQSSQEIDPQHLFKRPVSFKFPDGRDGTISFSTDSGQPWLSIFEEDPIEIRINLSHPFVNRFWKNKTTALPIAHFAIAIAQAELSNATFAQAGARIHINRWLEVLGSRDFDALRIEDYED